MTDPIPYAFHAFEPLSYEADVNVRDALDELLDRIKSSDGEDSSVTKAWTEADAKLRGDGALKRRLIPAHPRVINAAHGMPTLDYDGFQDVEFGWFWMHVKTGDFIFAECAVAPRDAEAYWQHTDLDPQGIEVYGSSQEVTDEFLRELIRINDVYRMVELPAFATITCPVKVLVESDANALASYFCEYLGSPMAVFGSFEFSGEADNGEIHIRAKWGSRMDMLIPPRGTDFKPDPTEK